MNDISAFADAARVFANHLADVKLGPLAVALLLHTINLLLRTGAWYSILRAAYPGVKYRYRSCAGAYLAGVGVNAIAPARGGDLVKIFLTRTRLEGSTTPTILASLLVETLIDVVLGIVILGYALTQHVLPRVPELPSLPAFEWSWAVANPTITAIIATFILLAGIITARRLHIAGKAFAARVRQGFTILRKPRRYALTVATPQLVGWVCRVGAAAAFLEAFGIPGTLRNALLVMVVGSLTTLLPVTPGGVGTQQALIVVVLSGAATDSQLLSYSVGAQAAVMVANALIGGIALVLMLRTLSLRSAIGHARHTQRADAHLASDRGRPARCGRPSRRRWPDGARSRGTAGRARPARARRCGRRRPSRAAPGARSARPAPRRPRAARRRRACGSRAARPGRCGCAGTTFQSTASPAIPSVASAPWTIVPDCSAQPSGRRLVAAKGAPQPSSVRSAVNAMPEKRPPA